MFASQLINSSGSTLSAIMPNVPSGTVFHMWDPGSDQFFASTFVPGLGWTPDALVNPGEGGILSAPSPIQLVLVGEVPQGGHAHEIPEGWSMHSSVGPVASGLDLMADGPQPAG
jgi:hypothetical protein